MKNYSVSAGLTGTNSKELNSSLPDEHLSKNEEKYIPRRGVERYKNELKHLIPIRAKEKDEGTLAVNSAGLFSLMSVSWISKFMYKAYNKGLKIEELPSVSRYDTCAYNTERLEFLWKEELAERGPDKASFAKVAWRFYRTRILIASFVHACNVACGIISHTFLIRKLLEYVQSGTQSYEEGIKWTLLLLAVEISRTLLWTWTRAFGCRTTLRFRSACLTLVYKKIIRMNDLGNISIGEVINIFSKDGQRIYELVYLIPMGIEAPMSTIFGIYYILHLFGPIAFLGMIPFLLYYPSQYLSSRLIGYFQTKSIKISDMRVRLINEILDCMKLIKMYAWEERFSKELLGIRRKERRALLRYLYCQCLENAMAPVIPMISTVVTFLAYVAAGNNLTAAQVFPYSSFLDSRLRLSLYNFQSTLSTVVSAGISFNRIQGLLLLEDSRPPVSKPILESQAVLITNGTFAYENSSNHNEKECSQTRVKNRNNSSIESGETSEHKKLKKPADNAEHVDVLFDISFEVEKGKLVGICGPVGSGKSSLLLAALGQLQVSEGRVMRDGSCAYVSQQAWITNATLRENILFGAKFDHSRYEKAIDACNLSQDISMMPGGDQTEIGEKGVNLSGGQKQRVALARALYADRDIYFLDDPLSAVDSRVGSYIFENLIVGALKGKTILFVTHQIQYLNRCDIIYTIRNGRIIEHGTHDQLMKLGNEYTSMVTAMSSDNENSSDQKIGAVTQTVENILLFEKNPAHTTGTSSSINAENVEKPNTAEGTSLTVAEDLRQGVINAKTYHSYIVAMGGYCYFLIVIFTFLLSSGSTAFSSWWLASWIEAGGGNTMVVRNNETIPSKNINDNPDFSYYQSIYAGTIGIMIITSIVRSFVYTRATIRASNKMHNDLFKKIIACPMRFFDTTPIGRIQDLFSRDIDQVDSKFPEGLVMLLQAISKILIIILVVCMVLPSFILPLSIICTIYYFLSKIFSVAIREFKRMDIISRAPVISFVTATVQGLSTIHAFGKEDEFIKRFENLFDGSSKHSFMFDIAVTWLTQRVDLLSVAMTVTTGFMVVTFQNQISPALAGMALVYAAQFSSVLPFTMRLVSETEARFLSVERIDHYIRNLVTEGSGNQPTVEPPCTWPAAAEIKFKNVSMAYGDNAPVILKNVSFNVEAGEKIGIVGRTGAGKSSITIALFRLAELVEGKIEIDDVDISEISLSQLRTKLSIIPQDPVLFSGTIRSNLDPFKLYTDAEIWKALEKTELKNTAQSINGQLDASVGFGGDNLSVGERQLLCLTRALLRNSKILVLDEATAAVDPETEIAVQNTVQREFSHCTILTIAHRLQTVLSLSRVLVMDDGKVLEFDTPSNLLENQSSEFSKMVAAAKKAGSQ